MLPPLGPGTTNNTVTCVLPSTNFDTPTAQVTYLLDFQLGSATVKYPVASDLSWDAGAFNDTILVNNQVETCVDVVSVGPRNSIGVKSFCC